MAQGIEELRQEFLVYLSREFPDLSGYDILRIGLRLLAVSRASHRIHLRVCNEKMDDALEARIGKRSDRLDAEAERLAAELGTRAILNPDPRGCPIYIVCPSGHTYGDWGGRGMAVPN
mgnify:CR=1 FL=1